MERTIDAILFDLDNTLYDARAGLQEEGDRRITRWIMDTLGLSHDAADDLRVRTWREYGTTAQGLHAEHDIPPQLMYEHCISPIDPSPYLAPWPELAAMLQRLTAAKYVFTNATETYTRRVLAALGVAEEFAGVFDIAYCEWVCKPNPESYRRIVADLGVAPARIAFVEDNAGNLEPAAELGMLTVLVADRPVPHADITIPSVLHLADALLASGVCA